MAKRRITHKNYTRPTEAQITARQANNAIFRLKGCVAQLGNIRRAFQELGTTAVATSEHFRAAQNEICHIIELIKEYHGKKT